MSCDLTFLRFFEAMYAPTYLVDAKPKTFEAYRESIKHWSRVHGPIVIDHATVEHLARFKQALLDGEQLPSRQRTLFECDPPALARKLAKSTVNKHLRNIMAMLAKAGPAGPRNRDALGLIASAPWVKLLKIPKRLPHAVDFRNLAAMYEACEIARFPKLGIFAGAWWQALLVMALTSAFRRAALMALTWEDVDLEEALVWLPAEIDKCGVERIKPLHFSAIQHLLKIHTGSAKLFPWPHSAKTYYQQWHAIQAAAGLAGDRRFTLHDLKRTAGTVYASYSSAWAVQQMLDHSSIKTSAHYVNVSDQLRETVDRFPLPQVMRKGG